MAAAVSPSARTESGALCEPVLRTTMEYAYATPIHLMGGTEKAGSDLRQAVESAACCPDFMPNACKFCRLAEAASRGGYKCAPYCFAMNRVEQTPAWMFPLIISHSAGHLLTDCASDDAVAFCGIPRLANRFRKCSIHCRSRLTVCQLVIHLEDWRCCFDIGGQST